MFRVIARDYNLQTNLGMQLEKLFFMDVANCSPHQLLQLSCSFGDIEGSGSNIFWLVSNRSVLELIENTLPNGTGPINANEPFLSADDAALLFNANFRVHKYYYKRHQFFYRESTINKVAEKFPQLFDELFTQKMKHVQDSKSVKESVEDD